MKKQDGIALIATLLIMAAIMALGVGTLFLSNMNLQIASNSRTSALAHYNAEAGLDAAIVQLAKDSKTTKQFPEKINFVLPGSPDSAMTYQLVTYDPYTVLGFRTRARVVILGTSPNNGSYQTEALIEATTLANEVDPTFPVGLVSEDFVSVNGGPTMKDAPLHGNKGYTIASSVNFQTCDASGNVCVTTSPNDRPLTAAKNPKSPPEPEWTYTCSASGQDNNVVCPGNPRRPWKYKEKPVSLKEAGVVYNKIRNGDDKTLSKFGVSSANTLTGSSPADCTTTVSSLAATYTAGSKVCVTGNVTLPSGANYSGITIVVKGSVTISSAATLTNTNLLSMGTINQNGPLLMTGSRLFADSKITIDNTIDYSGNSTIASGTDLEIISGGGEVRNTQGTEVGMAMMAVGNLTAQKLAGANGAYANVAVWAGGTASLNGGAKLRGGIGAGSRLEIKGTNEIYGKAIFVNPDLPLAESSAGSLSRR